MENAEEPKYYELGIQPIPLHALTLKRFLGPDNYPWFQEIFTDPEVQVIEENRIENNSPEILAWQMMQSEVFQQKVAEIREFGTSLILSHWFEDFKKQADRRFARGKNNGRYYRKRFMGILSGLRFLHVSLPKEAVVARYLAAELYDFVATRCAMVMHSYLGYECRTPEDDTSHNPNSSNESWSFDARLMDFNNIYFYRYDVDHPIFGVLHTSAADILQWIESRFTEPRHDTLLNSPRPEFSPDFASRLAEQRRILCDLSVRKQVDGDIEFTASQGYSLNGTISFPLWDRGNNYRELQQSLCFVDTGDGDTHDVSLALARCDGHLYVAESHIPFYYYFTDIEGYETYLFEVYEAAITAYRAGEDTTELTRCQDYAEKQLRRTKARRTTVHVVEDVEQAIEVPAPEPEEPEAEEALPEKPEVAVVEETVVAVADVLADSQITLQRTDRFDAALAKLSPEQQEKVLRKIDHTLGLFGTGTGKGIKKMEIKGEDTIYRLRYGGRRILFRHEGNKTFTVFNMDPRDTVYEQDLEALVK